MYGSDHAYKPDRLWSHFTAEKCPTLAGKPKLFFIQACQGDQLDSGVHLKRVSATETDSAAMSYKIPNHADFLIAYSTIPGFYSWRNTTAGSWCELRICSRVFMIKIDDFASGSSKLCAMFCNEKEPRETCCQF